VNDIIKSFVSYVKYLTDVWNIIRKTLLKRFLYIFISLFPIDVFKQKIKYISIKLCMVNKKNINIYFRITLKRLERRTFLD